MQLRPVALIAGLALAAVAGASARAEVYPGASAYRTEVFWAPADRLWSGGIAPQTCERNGRHRSLVGAAPRLQAAVYEQRGELIGEIRSEPAQAPKVLAQARSCATEADSATTTEALLRDAGRNWSTFSAAFASCLARNNASQYVGSMTLWIDERCDW